MFGSEILDVAIGLALIYLLLSLLSSAVREAIESATKSRATRLAAGIRELLGAAEHPRLLEALYSHPLIYGLYRDSYDDARRRKWLGVMPSTGLPSYIPSRSFAVALMDTVVRGRVDNPYAVHQVGRSLTVDNLRAALGRLESPMLQRGLLAALDTAGDDIATVQQNIERWFDSAMDRVSGSYKRRTQGYLLLIGLALTLAVNANTITIANHLARSKAAREALVARAREVARDSTVLASLPVDSARPLANVAQRYEAIATLDLPVGWNADVPRPGRGAPSGSLWNDWFLQILGLLVTGFAISFGAPFWFDILNKFMVIRSTVKPHEKSPEEGSEDRQPKQQAVAPAVAGAAAVAPAAPAAHAAAPAPPALIDAGFEPRIWSNEESDGGLL